MSENFTDRIARIRALAATVDARMEADDTAGSTGDEQDTGTETGKASEDTKSRSAERKPTKQSGESERAPHGDDADSTDWKAEARKHETRAKANRSAADKAAEDKAAADEARQQAESKHSELLDGIAKVLGVKQDDQPPDPAKLQQNLTDLGAKVTGLEQTVQAKDDEIAGRDRLIAAKEVELAAWRVAVRNGIDAVTLMDLRSTERRLGELDPSGDDFTKKLEEVVKDIAKDNPTLRTTGRDTTASEAGIGAAGSRGSAPVSPGAGRLRAAYSTS